MDGDVAADLMALIREAIPKAVVTDGDGDEACLYCFAWVGLGEAHREDCWVLRAKRLLGEG